jgi:pilus assembly protein CpaB
MRLTRRQATIIAIVCGLVAALLSYAYLRRAGSAQQPAAETSATVAVARMDLAEGTRLSPSMVGTKTIATGQVPTDALMSPQDTEGLVALVPIRAGEMLTRSNAREPSAALGLSFMVPEGMRAVTVALDMVSGVAGLAKPGDHVDIIATFDLRAAGTMLTRTVLQDIEVLAMGSQVAPGSEKAKAPAEGEAQPAAKVQPTATLAVTPQDAEKLIMSDAEGKLRLSLRRTGDKSYVQLPSVINWNLIGYRPAQEKPVVPPQQQPPQQQPPSWYQMPPPTTGPAPEPPRAPEAKGVEVFRGSQREVIVP